MVGWGLVPWQNSVLPNLQQWCSYCQWGFCDQAHWSLVLQLKLRSPTASFHSTEVSLLCHAIPVFKTSPKHDSCSDSALHRVQRLCFDLWPVSMGMDLPLSLALCREHGLVPECTTQALPSISAAYRRCSLDSSVAYYIRMLDAFRQFYCANDSVHVHRLLVHVC